MAYYSSDLSTDLAKGRLSPKRIIFYQQGLKIYAVLPYLLNMRLKGQFISNYWVQEGGAFSGVGIVAPTNEANYTAIPYSQSVENSQRLWDWLLADKGFEYAIAQAADFSFDIWKANVGQFPPKVWVPGADDQCDRFVKAFSVEKEVAAMLNGWQYMNSAGI